MSGQLHPDEARAEKFRKLRARITELEAALAQAEEFRVKGVLRIIELEDERDRYQEVAGRWESQCECECDRCIELLTVLLGD